MARSLFVFSVALASLVGCAAPTVPAEVNGTTSSALTDDATYPPRVDIAVGASRQEVCARDDGDTAAAFEKYRIAHGQPLGQWVQEGDVRVCRWCNLDNQTIGAMGRIRIENSTAKNASFGFGGIVNDGPPSVTVSLENVYARGADLTSPSSTFIEAKNVDFRCARVLDVTLGQKYEGRAYVSSLAHGVDLSGSSLGDVRIKGDAADIRFTGADLDGISVEGTLAGARLDNTAFDVYLLAAKLSGDIAFDRSTLAVHARGSVAFENGSLSLSGAKGSIDLRGPAFVMDHVRLLGQDGPVNMTGDLSTLRVSHMPSWAVGSTGLVPDAALASLDLTGTTLTSAKGEVWPRGSAVLDGLRLAHGAFPQGADLSKVSLQNAKLQRVRFTDATLSKEGTAVRFDGADLEQAVFTGKSIDGVSFVGADVRGATFAHAQGTAGFEHAKAGRLAAHTDDNDSGEPKDTSFEGAGLGASRFDAAQLQYTSFEAAKLADVTFDHAIADWASFRSASFFRSSPDGAGISNATLANVASLHGAKLNEADLRGASLAHLDLDPAGADATDFTGAFLCGADLTGAKLRGANLSNAYFDVDGYVTFPDGSSGTCVPTRDGGRSGADTSSLGDTVTQCPLYGDAPTGEGAQCSDAQWRLQGASCSAGQKQLRNGAPCTSGCGCQSLYCSAAGKCAIDPMSTRR